MSRNFLLGPCIVMCVIVFDVIHLMLVGEKRLFVLDSQKDEFRPSGKELLPIPKQFTILPSYHGLEHLEWAYE